MSRTVTGAMQTAAQAVPSSPILLWEGNFDSGTLRLWTGYGDLSWAGQTWVGSGELIQVEPAAEISGVISAGATFRLNGVDSSLVAIALLEEYQGRSCTLYFGALDAAGAVVVDPVPVFSGRMDVMEIRDRGDTVDFTLVAESHLADLNREPARFYTDEDQKAFYPTDRGLEFVAELQDREVVWK